MGEPAFDSKLETLFLIVAGALAIVLPFAVFAVGAIAFVTWLGGLPGGD